MRMLLTIMIFIGLIGGGVYWASNTKFTLDRLRGTKVEVTKGDLVIPVTAGGSIEPASITNIKSEASGAVSQLPYDVGMMVKEGDLIVELEEDDELRSLERAVADEERAKIALDKAKLAEQERRDVAIPLSKAKVEQAEAGLARVQAYYDKIIALESHEVSEYEVTDHKSRLKEAKAALDAANAEAVQAGIALNLAKEDVKSADQTLTAATNSVEDAKERLSETKINSPVTGMVLSTNIQVGELVLSSTKSFTGGTLLMQIADVSRIYAVVNVDEADIGRVRELAPDSARPGYVQKDGEANPAKEERPLLTMDQIDPEEMVEITVESFEDEKFYGEIERISPQSELVRAIATFQVRIRIVSDNRDKLVGLLNTQAEARFTVNAVKDATLVSWEAMKPNPDGDGFGVYTVVQNPETGEDDHKFRKVEFGVSDGVVVEVLSGLEVGEEVYTELPQKTNKQIREEREAKKK